jgi:sugar phosphate isomerase/epimerase
MEVEVRILFFCPYWGSERLGPADFCARAKDSGYDGIELALPLGDEAGTEAILSAAKGQSLSLVAQHWEMHASDFVSHKAEFVRRLEWLAAAHPLFINSQTGKDWFSFEQNRELLQAAAAVAAARGVRILHETHRGKFAFAASVAARYLREDPALRISADLSHWCVVAESLLHDQAESLDLAIERADHIHARVGFAEGPQVSDPRAPEYAEALSAHLGWWDRIVRRHLERGSDLLTVTPEFGPYPYMPSLPYTGQPVADQWSLNVYMADKLRTRWSG